MLPTSKPVRNLRRRAPASRGRQVLRSEGHSDLKPIGPERLKELRDAIRNGTYPSEADVMGGLKSLLDLD